PMSWVKRSTFEGRGAWTFMYLYNNLDPDPRHLEASRRSMEFIMKHYPEDDRFFPEDYTREGNPGKRGENLYGDMFIAGGLAQFSKAKGNEKYWDTARDIVMKCVRMYDKPGYNATKLTPNGTRYVGHWFILLRTATEMLEIRVDPDLKALADRCIDAQMNYHYNPDYHLHNEQINHDMTRPDNELVNFAWLGHASEMLWMTLYEAVRRKDIALFDENANMFRRNLEVAWDDVYGGLFIQLTDVEKNTFALGKAGWGQMESLIGLLCIIEHTGAPWAKEWFDKLHNWTMSKLPLKSYGLPLWQDYTGRKAEFRKGKNGRRAENYHHPRHLMLNLQAVQRIIERKGAVSNAFEK
ncbi:MAG: AGE family epimerase/isomerase, partial [Candidatus Latescibacterota bacterium]